ncbi:hypothetical protein VUJ46_05100 [Chryseobacterium sp. MYb264]|uniref:hypothetical protein n=1 Tax=Chryseobacterium sp. MYb264 TaxID=2745153 RepID=UPI002E14F1EA|nr:hypothetical protein VUJ46_05100 [Chryseobacterium sp. MYb264]
MDSLIIDSNYILNNKQNNGYTYRYILQLKNEKKLQAKSFTQAKYNPLQDITYVSLIVNQKLKKNIEFAQVKW